MQNDAGGVTAARFHALPEPSAEIAEDTETTEKRKNREAILVPFLISSAFSALIVITTGEGIAANVAEGVDREPG